MWLPSDRVQNGRFGACLMASGIGRWMCCGDVSAVAIPVTIKSRIGIDERDSYPELAHLLLRLPMRLQNIYCYAEKPG